MKKIMFLGNSFTFFNEMPTLFKNLSVTDGKEVKIGQVTRGGAALRRYLVEGEKWEEIFRETFLSDDWDYLVMQDQSMRPAVCEKEFSDAAHELCEIAAARGTVPVFYQTWPYRDNTAKLETTGCSYVELYLKLRDAYRRAAAAEHAQIVPVGDVFYRLSLSHPEIDLLNSDNFHPSLYGSYAAALMFYYFFWGTDAQIKYLPENIEQEKADCLIKEIREVMKAD